MFNLSKRETILLQVLIVIVIIAGIYYLIISPLVGFIEGAEEELENNVKNISRLDGIFREHREVKNKIEKYTSQLKQKVSITVLIEQWANSTGIAGNIGNTRNSQKVIQNKYIQNTTSIKINGVAIQSFLKFLYEIENSNYLIKVNYLRIRPALKSTYDVNLKINSYSLKD